MKFSEDVVVGAQRVWLLQVFLKIMFRMYGCSLVTLLALTILYCTLHENWHPHHHVHIVYLYYSAALQ